MKKILIACMAFMAMCHTVSANDNNLYIVPNTGDVVTWKIAALQKMMFQNGSMILVMKDGTSTYIPIASVQKMQIRVDEASSIDGVESKAECTWDGVNLHIGGLTVGKVLVYGINGSLLMQSVLDADGNVNLSSLQSGVYIVNVGGTNVKIVK